MTTQLLHSIEIIKYYENLYLSIKIKFLYLLKTTMRRCIFSVVLLFVSLAIFAQMPSVKVENEKGELINTTTLLDGKTPSLFLSGLLLVNLASENWMLFMRYFRIGWKKLISKLLQSLQMIIVLRQKPTLQFKVMVGAILQYYMIKTRIDESYECNLNSTGLCT